MRNYIRIDLVAIGVQPPGFDPFLEEVILVATQDDDDERLLERLRQWETDYIFGPAVIMARTTLWLELDKENVIELVNLLGAGIRPSVNYVPLHWLFWEPERISNDQTIVDLCVSIRDRLFAQSSPKETWSHGE